MQSFARTAASLAWDFARTRAAGSSLFGEVEKHCFFVGCPRSGHSIVGALLDAHPEVIVSHELGALRYLRARFSREQILSLVLENSRRAALYGRHHFIYSLNVPGAWQGRFDTLRVIGDKHGEGTLLSLRSKPSLLQRAVDAFANVRLVHVVRNPYDAIASIALSPKRRMGVDGAIEYYFSLCRSLQAVHHQMPRDHWFELQHETLIRTPREVLGGLAGFLGLDAPERWLSACERVLFREPHETRREVEWQPRQIEAVRSRAAAVPFARGYEYD